MNPPAHRPHGRRPAFWRDVDAFRLQIRSVDYDVSELERRCHEPWYVKRLITDLAELVAGAQWLEEQLGSKQAA